jgi:uncharacterized protein
MEQIDRAPATMPYHNPHLVLPVGTQVVMRVALKATNGAPMPRGAVGVVVAAPAETEDTYAVRFPDGAEANAKRAQMSIRKHAQADALVHATPDHEALRRYVIYRCVVGSRAFGLDGAESDTDRRGIYLPPAALHWSLAGVPTMIERPGSEEAYWELQHFLELALKANPNVLECLWTPVVEHATPLAEELLAMRDAFLSQLVYQTYNGYVMSQFKKLETDLRTTGTLKWKHAMHLIRLLLAGIIIMERGEVPVAVSEHRDELLLIRQGAMPWDEVNRWRLALHRRFDAALSTTRLSPRPNTARVDAFLVRARRSMVEETR